MGALCCCGLSTASGGWLMRTAAFVMCSPSRLSRPHVLWWVMTAYVFGSNTVLACSFPISVTALSCRSSVVHNSRKQQHNSSKQPHNSSKQPQGSCKQQQTAAWELQTTATQQLLCPWCLCICQQRWRLGALLPLYNAETPLGWDRELF